VPYCPTPDEVINKIIKELDIKPNKHVYDLGCGDGRFLFAAEKLGAKTFGFEISLPSYLRAQLKIKKHRLRTKIYFKNFYSANFNDADIVFCFLTKKIMGKVEQLFKDKLKAGTVIVIYGASLPNLKPFKTVSGKIWSHNEISKINFYKI
jgi:SAM-dependent methyltransferase